MKKLAGLTLETAPRAHAERLRRWLHAWRIEQALQGADTEPRQAPERNGAKLARLASDPARETRPEPGQVRLLCPELTTDAARPVYVALLCGLDAGLLAAPFSRFTVPAVAGETLTVYNATALRVLCLWNARTLPRRALQQSWLVDRLEPGSVARLVTAWRFLQQNDRPPPGLEDHCGPPLNHPDDPRHDYLAAETALMDGLEATAVEFLHGHTIDLYPGNDENTDLPKAAEPDEGYGTDDGPRLP